MTSLSRPKKTIDDFMALGDEVRAELIDGEIYMAASPSLWHQTVSRRLATALDLFVEEAELGEIWCAPLDVFLPSGDVVEPDLIFASRENMAIAKDRIRGTPDLLVEILSPGNPGWDRIVKRRLYAENGVTEYWIVDPEERTIEVLRVDGDTFAPAGFFGIGTILTSEVLPGLALSMEQVFRPRPGSP